MMMKPNTTHCSHCPRLMGQCITTLHEETSMSGSMQRWYLVLPLLLASACTTLEDFQAMGPDERAEKVCSGTAAYRDRKWGLNSLNDEIMARQQLLATGYRVHEYCRVVTVTVPARAADCGNLAGDELAACQKKSVPAHAENRRVCEQVAVPIDYHYETAVLRNLQLTRDEQLAFHEQQSYLCVARARSLSVDEAYSRYKAGMEP